MRSTRVDAATSFADTLGAHDGLALVGRDGTALAYAELASRVGDERSRLDALGPRQLVHLSPSSDLDFVVAWLAALQGGHPVLLSDRETLADAYGASVRRGAGAWTTTGRTAPDLHPDLRLLLSTSGSTGSPKLVRLSAANLASNAAAIAEYLGLGPDDVGMTTLPLDYCYGLSVLHSHLAAGASVVLDDRSVTDPELWRRARRHGVTTLAGVPHTFDLLAAAQWPELPTLRRVTQAGGRLAPERVRELALRGRRDGWELFVMYGQTEATARMAYLPPHLALSHPGRVGVAIPGGELRVEPCADQPAGVGELVYRGPNVMLGYATHPADLARGADLDELRTGDLARIDADGLVEIVGRRSRFAKLLGQRVDLDRVEALLRLAGHDAAVAESVDGDRLVVAVRAPQAPALLGGEVLEAVTAATGLPPHLVRVAVVHELPRRPNGKVDQAAVASLAASDHVEAAPTTAEVGADDLAALYARVLHRAEARPDRSFVDLGGDSLSYVELALRLERHLGTLPADWPRRTPRELAARAAQGTATTDSAGPGTSARARGPRPTRWWRSTRLETGIALRAVAIVLIVGSHADVWVLLGGAHVLLALAGANLARFQLVATDDARARVRRVVRAAARIAVPSMLFLAAVALVRRDLPWTTVLLLNDLLGPQRWTEPAWHYWFVEVLVLLTLAAGIVTTLPWVRRLEVRHPFALAAGLTALALAPRWWVVGSGYEGDVIHSTLFVAWLFAGGWAAEAARGPAQRLLISVLLLAGAIGFTASPERDLLIAAGLLLLVWARTVPWPALLVRPAGQLASASLWIYLTHWQVYPWFENRAPIAGLLLSLAIGVATAHTLPALGRRAGAAARHGVAGRRASVVHAARRMRLLVPAAPLHTTLAQPLLGSASYHRRDRQEVR
ncbi:AMP-binding protein [Nocardioides sp.]|uniref:AMP-binding protein n=1 Tax=Nocardioides sp. TaxID=35761 RepID=UPI003515E3AE